MEGGLGPIFIWIPMTPFLFRCAVLASFFFLKHSCDQKNMLCSSNSFVSCICSFVVVLFYRRRQHGQLGSGDAK